MASANADSARWPGYTQSGGNSPSTCHLSGKRPFPAEAERQRRDSQFPQRDRPAGLSLWQRFLIDFREMVPNVTSLTNRPDTGYSETSNGQAIQSTANISE